MFHHAAAGIANARAQRSPPHFRKVSPSFAPRCSAPAATLPKSAMFYEGVLKNQVNNYDKVLHRVGMGTLQLRCGITNGQSKFMMDLFGLS